MNDDLDNDDTIQRPSTKTLIYLGGGAAAIVVVLLVASAVMRRRDGGDMAGARVDPHIDPDNWQVSFKRVVSAFEFRCAGFDQRLNEMTAIIVQLQNALAQSSQQGYYQGTQNGGGNAPHTAAMSLPPDGLIPPNPAFTVPVPVGAGEQLPPPPGPAAVSVLP